MGGKVLEIVRSKCSTWQTVYASFGFEEGAGLVTAVLYGNGGKFAKGRNLFFVGTCS